MDTNSSLRQHLILALTSDAGDLHSASAQWAQTSCSLVFSDFLPHTPGKHVLKTWNSGTKMQPYAGPPEEKRCSMGISINPK